MGLVSGLGGGIIRDVLLQHGTPVALTHAAYIPTALAGAAIAFLMRIEHRAWDRLFLLVDAAAISLWASAGALKTLTDGLGWLPAVLLGTITAIGGGVTREIILQRVPAVFTEGPLYATVAIFVAAVTVVCAKTIGPDDTVGTAIALVAGFTLRLVAYRRGWQLPQGLEWQPRRLARREASDGDQPGLPSPPPGWRPWRIASTRMPIAQVRAAVGCGPSRPQAVVSRS
jgi:uncharacterized membrane protein YeiH